jgi:uncharacterized membrane protein
LVTFLEDYMERIEKSCEINAPVRAVYNQWTQFEEFPRFMDGVKEVRQTDDTHLHWRASIGGKDKEWDAEITEQVPDQVIAWRSISGAPNNGKVQFQPMGANRTRVQVIMEYDPQGIVENVGDALGMVSSKVERTVEEFKEFIENRGRETGAWRGEVHGSEKTGGRGGMERDPEAASPNLGLGSGGGGMGTSGMGSGIGGNPSSQGGSNPSKGMPGTDTSKPTGGKGGRSKKRST